MLPLVTVIVTISMSIIDNRHSDSVGVNYTVGVAATTNLFEL